ncbi:hypothetical protein [Frankia sp. CiP3]|uniref:hypothetical protein n=1 Tax=Frankia sp. CiP3 TaxID=2880971 RepID=UPI0035AB8026
MPPARFVSAEQVFVVRVGGGQVLRGCVRGARGVLVGADDGGVDGGGPVGASCGAVGPVAGVPVARGVAAGFAAPVGSRVGVGAGAQGVEDALPGAVRCPQALALVEGSVGSVAVGDVPLRAAGPFPVEDPVDHLVVVAPPVAVAWVAGEVWCEAFPFLVRQIMSIFHSR